MNNFYSTSTDPNIHYIVYEYIPKIENYHLYQDMFEDD